jgi:large repetitive protein
LPETDIYTLAIQGSGDSPIDYKFKIITPDRPSTMLTALGTNQTPNAISDSIGKKGDQDTYKFAGAIGQRLYLDVLSVNGGYYYYNSNTTNASLYSPSGVKVLDQWLYYGDSAPITLTEAGEYRLVFDGSGENTENYSFSLMNVGEATAVSFNVEEKIGQLNPGREAHLYRFSGSAAQNLYIDSLLPASGASWTLYDSSNRAISGNYAGSDIEISLPETDIYTLAIQGSGDSPIDYKFKIITPDRPSTMLTALGTNQTPNTISDAIGKKGDQDTYKFAGAIGQRLYLDVLSVNGGYYNANTTNASLYSPSGVKVLDQWLYYGDSAPITLTEAGEYRLVVDGYSESTENYSFSLMNVGQAMTVPSNQ